MLAQPVEAMQVLCVDDGSADASPERLRAWRERDRRIEVITLSHASAGAARNNGLTHAVGTYVHFLDADDCLFPDLYPTLIREADRSGADVCVFQYAARDVRTGITRREPCLLDRKKRTTSLRREPAFWIYNLVAPWNKLYRRDWLEKNRLRFDEITCANDRGFYFRMLAADPVLLALPVYGVIYYTGQSGALTGSGRAAHPDCLFFSYHSVLPALEPLPVSIRAMVLDAAVTDLFAVLAAAPEALRSPLREAMHRYFQTLDLSVLEALPFACLWREDLDRLRESPEGETRPPHTAKKLGRLLRIWGLRGCLVKWMAHRNKKNRKNPAAVPEGNEEFH